MIRRLAFLPLAIVTVSAPLKAADSSQSGLSHEDWSCAQSTSKAIQVALTNNGLIDQNKVDNDKTEIKLLAKEQLPYGATQQVFLMTVHETTGRSVTFIAQSKTAGLPGATKKDYECPYSEPTGYVVSKVL